MIWKKFAQKYTRVGDKWIRKSRFDNLVRVNDLLNESKSIATVICKRLGDLAEQYSHGTSEKIIGWGFRKHESYDRVLLRVWTTCAYDRKFPSISFDWVDPASVEGILCTKREDLGLLIGRVTEKQKGVLEGVLRSEIQCYPYRQDLVDEFFLLTNRHEHALRVSHLCYEIIEHCVDNQVRHKNFSWYDDLVVHLKIGNNQYYLTRDRIHGWKWMNTCVDLQY